MKGIPDELQKEQYWFDIDDSLEKGGIEDNSSGVDLMDEGESMELAGASNKLTNTDGAMSVENIVEALPAIRFLFISGFHTPAKITL